MAQATACVSPYGNRRNGRARPYDRAKAMQWLLERCPTSDFPDLTDDTPAGRAAIIEMLQQGVRADARPRAPRRVALLPAAAHRAVAHPPG